MFIIGKSWLTRVRWNGCLFLYIAFKCIYCEENTLLTVLIYINFNFTIFLSFCVFQHYLSIRDIDRVIVNEIDLSEYRLQCSKLIVDSANYIDGRRLSDCLDSVLN